MEKNEQKMNPMMEEKRRWIDLSYQNVKVRHDENNEHLAKLMEMTNRKTELYSERKKKENEVKR